MKTLLRVRTEMSLQVLAYNLKRALNIVGTQLLVIAGVLLVDETRRRKDAMERLDIVSSPAT